MAGFRKWIFLLKRKYLHLGVVKAVTLKYSIIGSDWKNTAMIDFMIIDCQVLFTKIIVASVNWWSM